jgi:nucleoside-diphosphate-sugar epimerase
MRPELASRYAGRRALVTGGLGFIGSALARRLLSLGAEVSVIDALVPGHGGNPFNVEDVRDRLGVSVADVCERAAIEGAVAGQDYLFHLAGQVSHTDSMRDPVSDLGANCSATLSVLEACRRLNPSVRIAFAGTRQIYGRPQRPPSSTCACTTRCTACRRWCCASPTPTGPGSW